MNCIRLRLDAAATTIVVWDGRLIIETSGAPQISRELESATGSRMFSVAKVSDKTGFTAGAVRAWLKAGKLAGVRIGREYRVHERDLCRFLEGVKEPVAGEKMRIGRRLSVKF
jgi:excisionase family DNA binding protein